MTTRFKGCVKLKNEREWFKMAVNLRWLPFFKYLNSIEIMNSLSGKIMHGQTR